MAGTSLYCRSKCVVNISYLTHNYHDRSTSLGRFGFIDRDRVICLNERMEGMGKRCIKPWDMRLDTREFVDSDEDDPQLILTIPFTVAVKVIFMCQSGVLASLYGCCLYLYQARAGMHNSENHPSTNGLQTTNITNCNHHSAKLQHKQQLRNSDKSNAIFNRGR
jgi:hypothetical protein